jgi:hypothetical protein
LQWEVLSNAPELNLSPELIRLIPANEDTLKQLLTLRNIPEDYVIEQIVNLWSKLSKNDLYELIKTTKFSPEGIETLWNSKGVEGRIILLQNPSIGTENLKKFALSKNSAYRFSVAHNKTTDPDDLDILSTDESVSTRSAVAANPNTSQDTLKQLAGDEAVAVRTSIASNPSTPNNILILLKKDSDQIVRKTASTTLKSLQATEAAINAMIGMGSLLLEELNDDDDETTDLMMPDWRDIPNRLNMLDISNKEFVTVFLLQNNGHATREEISQAFEDWKGVKGSKSVWSTDHRNGGTTTDATSSKGWWWSPPNINKGALYRITPAGAAVGLATLKRIRKLVTNPQYIDSTTARLGRKYYTQNTQEALDVTGHEDVYVTKTFIRADQLGAPLVDMDGKFIPVRSRIRKIRTRWNGPQVEAYELVPINDAGKPDEKNVKFVSSLPTVNVPGNVEVEFIRSNYDPFAGHHAVSGTGLVKYKGKSLIIRFPLWARPMGAKPNDLTPGVMPPVRKSPPPAALAKKISSPVATTTPDEESPVAATATPARRGPKSTYKIYGKFKGHPAATRLKGQAYVAADDTQFKSGEQAIIEPEDGKLRVKKTAGDHSQLWSPIDG